MTDLAALAERTPDKATFNVGAYSDGSGPVVEVHYDATSESTGDRIWIEAGSENWIAVDWQYADELADTIKRCAAALRARAATTEGEVEG